MLEKIKSIVSLITFFGAVLILFIFGSSITGFLFQARSNSGQQESLLTNPADSFKCGTMQVYHEMIKKDPDFNRRQQELETFTKNYVKNLKPANRNVVTIPVVVHIIYLIQQMNISNAVVQSQIDVLNKDYRRLNSDTVNTPSPFKILGGDPQIEFELAKRDPLGNPSIGITRTQTTVETFYMENNYVKFAAHGGHDIWDRNKYLNIWVCNLGGVYGYSQFLGGDSATDGEVIRYTAFGTIGEVLDPIYKKGRITTHEIGHWFNLRHIWGDAFCGSDSVDDTPRQQAYNYPCPYFPHITCDNGPIGDMFMNFMDYTVDDCMNIYTIGQSNRMNACLNSIRSSLLTSNGGTPVSGIPIAHFRSDKMTVTIGQNINFFDASGGIPTSWQWTFEGGNPSTSNIQDPSVAYQNAGLYSVKLKVNNSFGTDSVTYANYVKVQGANMSAFSIAYPPTNTFINTSDTTSSIFTWNRSSLDPSVSYKWKIRKDGTITEISYNSNNNGSDSLITLRHSFLDSLAMNFGGNSDTVSCLWRVFSYNGTDSLSSQNQNFIFIVRHTVGIKVISPSVPSEFKLFQNYPNPFNPVTKIRFDLPSGFPSTEGRPTGARGNDRVVLKIFDILGKEIATLVNEQLQPGTYEVEWNATRCPSGVYFYRLTTGNFIETKKMLMIK
jgi:PKD repeat protein